MSAALGTKVQFGLLGVLEARCGGAEVSIAPGKQRAVLAVLLLRAGRVVPVDELAEMLWGPAPPPTARVTVQNYVMRLRKALGDAGRELITTRPPGYLISLDAAELDVTRFEGLLGEARMASRDGAWATAADRSAAALALWRGDPLSDVESEELALREVPRLTELRLQALETRIDADLRLGRHAEVIVELQELVAEHPLREHFHAQRMLALYRGGRLAEALAAYQQARQTLVDQLGAEPGTELRELHQRILAADPGLAAPQAEKAQAAGPVQGAAEHSRPGGRESPYQGLSAFRERDAAFFFGRETAARQLLERMARCLDGPGLLVVSGASGVGKSSLLHAGILPRLRTAGLPGAPGSASWPCLVLTPGRAPLDELAVGAARLAGVDAAGVRRGLDADPAGFVLTARQAALAGERQAESAPDADGQPRRLLLLVDQFEQLFTRCPEEDQRRSLVTALHAAATGGPEPGPEPGTAPAALVVLAVRADFEARCAEYPELADAVQARYLVTPMTARQLRMAITEPARTAGATVNEDLVAVLLRELGSRLPSNGSRTMAVPVAGALPLLSHALDQAWRNRSGDVLNLADYERVGGIEGAVADSAQHAYDRLTPAQRVAAREVFTRLTTTSSDGTDTADRAPKAELIEGKSPAAGRDVTAVLEAFAAERLLTLTADSVEISHEVLLSAWPLLRDSWLADTHADRIARTRLHTTAAEWARQSRDPSYLYKGSLLDAASETAARIRAEPGRNPPLSQTESDFLTASARARRRTVRLWQAVIALLVVLVLGLASAAATALHASQVATRQRDAAVAGQLIAQSGSIGDSDPVLAKLESVAAWRIDPSAQARDAMLNAAALPGIAVLGGNAGAVYAVAYSPDGRTLAVGSGSSSGTGEGAVRLWDVAARHEIGVIRTGDDGAVTELAFSPDGKTVAVGTWNGTVSLWDVAARRQIGAPLITGSGTGNAHIVKSVAFSADGTMLAAARSDGTVRLWHVTTRRQAGAFTAAVTAPGSSLSGAYSVAFSPDGKTVAVGGGDEVRLLDVATGRQVGAPVTGAATFTVFSVAFSPDSKTLAIGSVQPDNGYGTVRLLNVATGHVSGTVLAGAADGITRMAFSPDGKTLATGGYEGTVRLFDVASRSQLGGPLTGDTGEISSIAFSPDGTTLATGSYDGTARLWNAATAARYTIDTALPRAGGKTTSAVLSPDGKLLAAVTSSGTVQLFDVASGRPVGGPLTAGSGRGYTLAFNRNGTMLAAVAIPGVIRIWDVATGRQVGSVPNDGHYGGYFLAAAFSPDGRTLAAVGTTITGAGIVRLLNMATGAPTAGPLGAGGEPYPAVAFSPDGGTLATGSIDGTVRLWDVPAGKQARSRITVGSSAVVTLAFSPDGKTLAVGTEDGRARLFDVATGRQIGNVLTIGVPFFNLTFSPDGGSLSAAEPDGTVLRWYVAYTADPAAYLCASAGQSLTPAEWARYVQGPPYQNVCP